MARTELTGLLRRMHMAHRRSAATGLPADELFEQAELSRRELSRRDFIARTFSAVVSAALVPATLPRLAAGAPRIAIVGAGLAGITCAYRLRQAGIGSTIYEAGGGLGGRTWTLRGFFEQGQTAENGGEFISSEHVATRKLAAELGLTLDDLRTWDAQQHANGDIYWVRGQRYPVKQMLADYGAVFPKLERDNAAAGLVRYDRHNQAGYTLDHTSAREWIERNVPGGLQSRLGWLLDIDATTENGGESSAQSALEVIYMLADMPALNPKGGFYLVGTDERYRVREGNDQMVARMARLLNGVTINVGARLTALRRRSDGSYLCTFSNPEHTYDAAYDHVVLALPFKTLRDCDLSQAGFSPVKIAAISQLPMGTNVKLHVQFKQRAWFAHDSNGATYADTGYQQTWEDTRAQAGSAGVLLEYNGGAMGASWDAPSFGPAAPSFVHRFLKQLEPVYPGIGAQWNGKAFLDNWPKDRWHRGSYSYWGVGNCTSFVGIEPVRQGNVHFCGEQCSLEFGGFMEGAVETGEAAAREVVRDLKGAAAAALIGSFRAV
ncbi:MAG: FAD-dependent oxidoreductase [Candidatus Eremiobacteraeota bacterium]|nr:FAD-dependent oxidoreductase [Candidatus Eremiobacteraeota bacterium]MBV8366961.1 FAD-dependent oxidoreductase [Candidatus Eremiobacteraeota bacterium]